MSDDVDVAQWLTDNREEIAGYMGVPVMPADLAPEQALAWGWEVLRKAREDSNG